MVSRFHLRPHSSEGHGVPEEQSVTIENWVGVYDLTKGEIGSDLGKMNLGALKNLKYLDVLREWRGPHLPIC